MDTPIYSTLMRAPVDVPEPTPEQAAPLSGLGDLLSELDVCSMFADGTRHGELVPLAGFTRVRMARALRKATATLRTLVAPRGADLISIRRASQINRSGHTPERDYGRANELIAAASSYLQAAEYGAHATEDRDGRVLPPGGWPWSEGDWNPKDDPIRDLATAGALIAAAIDSLQLPQQDGIRPDAHLLRRIST